MSLKEMTLKNSVKVLDLNTTNRIQGGCGYWSNNNITLPSGGGTPPPIMATIMIAWQP